MNFYSWKEQGDMKLWYLGPSLSSYGGRHEPKGPCIST